MFMMLDVRGPRNIKDNLAKTNKKYEISIVFLSDRNELPVERRLAVYKKQYD